MLCLTVGVTWVSVGVCVGACVCGGVSATVSFYIFCICMFLHIPTCLDIFSLIEYLLERHCVCVCMSVCVCVCLRTCACLHLQECGGENVSVCVCVHVSVYACAWLCVCVCVCVCVFVRATERALVAP